MSSSRESAARPAGWLPGPSSRFPRCTSCTSILIRLKPSSSAWRAAVWVYSFLIPLRRYFVREMHGLLPYPEATAITEVLVTGEKGGSQAKLLLQATVIAGVYDLFVTTFQVWKEYVDFQFVPVMHSLADRARMVFKFDAIGFILGLGYVMGLRSSMILCAGGVLSNFVLVPMIWFIGSHIDVSVTPPSCPFRR
jgi:uncharacterized oligopeptide transporter (OPT) family protein